MKNNYVVRVLDLPEHERVILKLIFSISEKSKLRNNAYTLASDLHEPADVVIRDAGGAHTPCMDVRHELLVVDAPATTLETPVILRPLIATRVLAVLDDVFAAVATAPRAVVTNLRLNTKETESIQPGPSVVVPLITTPPKIVDLARAPPSAPEAPAHLAEHGIPASQGADVAAMVDAVLLSTPADGPQVDIFSPSGNAAVSTPMVPVKSRVLVVDNSPAVCKQLEIELLQFDVEVDYVPSARKAIEMLGKYSYKVAFLDVVLPDWDGYKICKHIKAKAPMTAVVMLTDKATTGDKLRGALAGCDAFLLKPISHQTFQAAVKNRLPALTNTQALGA